MEHVHSLNDFVEKTKEAYSLGGTPMDRTDLSNMGTQLLRELKDVHKALDVVGNYNSFEPEEVYEILADEWYRISTVAVGFEGSPVVYVWMKDDAPQAYYHSVYVRLAGASPDEIDYVMGRSLIRAWWD